MLRFAQHDVSVIGMLGNFHVPIRQMRTNIAILHRS